jgi:hypothetical protein
MLCQDNLGAATPKYDIGYQDLPSYVLDRHGVPLAFNRNGPVLLPLHPWNEVSVEDSVASCMVAAADGQDKMVTGHPWDVRRMLGVRDLTMGSVLMSAQTFLAVGELVVGQTFLHRFVPHGLAIFCAEAELTGMICYDEAGMKFGMFVRGYSVVPALVLGSTDVEMARMRAMDLVEVMCS